MGDVTANFQSIDLREYRRGGVAGDPADAYVIPVEDKIATFKGRTSTFITPGRATATQRIFAIHNASGSSVIVCINRLVVDILSTAVKAVTVFPPLIRLNRFTAVPTGGTSLAATAMTTGGSSSTSVTLWGDSSADNTGAGTSSASALTVTPNPTTAIACVYGPRILATASGYELVDTAPFFVGEPDIFLRAGEGVAVSLDQAATGASPGNPTTDKWTVFCDWFEYTQP